MQYHVMTEEEIEEQKDHDRKYAYELGQKAFFEGVSYYMNPFDEDKEMSSEWEQGWLSKRGHYHDENRKFYPIGP